MSRLALTENNWDLITRENRTAQFVPDSVKSYFPIPEFDIPILLENKIIAISASSNSADEKWKFAGKALQVIQSGLTVGGQSDTVNSVKKFYLNQISLLQFPDTTPEYTLRINIPYWIRDIQLILWEYTGPITNTYDQILGEIKAGLQ